MKSVLKEIKKHLFIYFIFVKNCLIKQMTYRANFFMMVAIEGTFLFIKLMYLIVVYRAGVEIYGFTPDDILLFSGTYIFISGIYVALFYFNFINIQQYVGEGSLDLFITKPVFLQFITTLRNVDFGTFVPNLIGGIIIIAVGWQRAAIPLTFRNIAGFIVFMISGTLITYAIMLAPQLLCFWIIKGNALKEITDSLWDFGNMPMNIYKKWMQRLGTFVLPIFLVSNFSPLFVLNRLDTSYIIWGIVAPVLFIVAVRLFWNVAIRNYSSASS